jgi:hypothetical protein
MSRDSNVIRLRQPDAIDDPLTEVAREGARRMLAAVLIAEADAFVALWNDVKLPDGRDRVVRHGHGPERAIQTGVGPVAVRRPKVRDRGKVGASDKIRFTSSILPKWARRTRSLDALIPILSTSNVSSPSRRTAGQATGKIAVVAGVSARTVAEDRRRGRCLRGTTSQTIVMKAEAAKEMPSSAQRRTRRRYGRPRDEATAGPWRGRPVRFIQDQEPVATS